MTRDDVLRYVADTYHTKPDFPWPAYPSYAVLRHDDNRKWYGILMEVPFEKTSFQRDGRTGAADLLSLKISDPVFHEVLSGRKGYGPAYHLNKASWIACDLDRLAPDEVFPLIDSSFMATASAKTRLLNRPPKDWLIPSNSHYWNPREFFTDGRPIRWKQSLRTIRTGDTIYLYAGVPIGAILYRCLVTKTGIPAHFEDFYHIRVEEEMELTPVAAYPDSLFTRERLKRDYGIVNVRGPRGIPPRLKHDLEAASGDDVRTF